MAIENIITISVLSVFLIIAIVVWICVKTFSKNEEIDYLNDKLDELDQDIRHLNKKVVLLANPPKFKYKDRVIVSQSLSEYHNKTGTIMQVTRPINYYSRIYHKYTVDLDDTDIKEVITFTESNLEKHPYYDTKEA